MRSEASVVDTVSRDRSGTARLLCLVAVRRASPFALGTAAVGPMKLAKRIVDAARSAPVEPVTA